MPQASRVDANDGFPADRQTEAPPPEPPGLGNPTTLLLLLVAAAFLWWSMRRRRAFEERLREQRHEETVSNAELSARNVANIMRAKPTAGDAAAAASEGLASAAQTPLPDRFAMAEPPQADAPSAPEHEAEQARVIERAEAAALAERAAAEEAKKAARAAELAGESEARRLAAAAAAAEEARADGADAMRAQPMPEPFPVADQRRQEATDALRAGLRELENEPEVPLGAIVADGTAICPPSYPVKGNAQAMIYHVPGQPSYPPIVPDFCFASAEAAEAAGFRDQQVEE